MFMTASKYQSRNPEPPSNIPNQPWKIPVTYQLRKTIWSGKQSLHKIGHLARMMTPRGTNITTTRRCGTVPIKFLQTWDPTRPPVVPSRSSTSTPVSIEQQRQATRWHRLLGTFRRERGAKRVGPSPASPIPELVPQPSNWQGATGTARGKNGAKEVKNISPILSLSSC